MKQKVVGIFLLIGTPASAWSAQSLISYALKQGLSQGSLLLRARPTEKVLQDSLSSEELKKYILLSREVLENATKLPMKTGSAYRRYVHLDRDWVTQIVVAARKDQLEVKNFSFPIAGSFPYKGFFSEEDASAEALSLSSEFDVYQRKVPAFSSLGWFSDPLVSTLFRSEAYLVETLFHELVHLNFYFNEKGDFNEAFATWFAQKAAQDFAPQSKLISDLKKFKSELEASAKIDGELNSFVTEITEKGKAFYARSPLGQREKYFAWVSSCLTKYPSLKWLEKTEWNNASILSFSTYYRLVPTIEKYALANSLDYKTFLRALVSRGPAMADEIESQWLADSKRRCVQDIP